MLRLAEIKKKKTKMKNKMNLCASVNNCYKHCSMYLLCMNKTQREKKRLKTSMEATKDEKEVEKKNKSYTHFLFK